MLNKEQVLAMLKKKYALSKDSEISDRYQHSIRVADMAVELIKHHHLPVDLDKAYFTGLVHDYAKFYTKEDFEELIVEYDLDPKILEKTPKLWHAFLGKYAVMHDFKVTDSDILNAVMHHSAGRAEMSPLEEVIFVADYIERGRSTSVALKAREIAFVDIKRAVYYILTNIMRHVLESGEILDVDTQYAYRYYRKYKMTSAMIKVEDVINVIGGANLAKDIKTYDLTNNHPLYDYVIIATAESNKQMQACVNHLKNDFTVLGVEAGEEWTLIDLGDIIVHIFKEEGRTKYALDKLYANLLVEKD